jgi:hypothetical protein
MKNIKIIEKPLYLHDLEDIDPEVAKNLIETLNNDVTDL